jgi:hypothetical protein
LLPGFSRAREGSLASAMRPKIWGPRSRRGRPKNKFADTRLYEASEWADDLIEPDKPVVWEDDPNHIPF